MAIESGAEVLGIDAAPGLLEIARQRNPQNTFLDEDLEALPFAADSFHFISGFNSFQYAANFEDALREAKRVLKPGGKLVLAIWDKPEASDATQVLRAVSSLLPPPPAGSPGPFALSQEGVMEAHCLNNGLKLQSKLNVNCPILYRNADEGVKSFMSTGPAAAALQFNEKATVEQTILKALRQFRVADDFHFLQNSFLLFTIQK